MNRNFIWFSLLLLFILEGGLFPWLIPVDWRQTVGIAPHFVFIGIMYIAILLNRHAALTYGLIFGLLQDIVYYGHMLGPHLFCMGFIGYLTGLGFRRAYVTIAPTMIAILFGNFVYSILIFGIYRMFKVTYTPFSWTLTHQILPGLVINLLFALLIYIPVRSYFGRAVLQREKE